jgi:hypothetical protein
MSTSVYDQMQCACTSGQISWKMEPFLLEQRLVKCMINKKS